MAEQFGPYSLEEVIGRGGMGVVYRAYDTRRDRTVALKRLPRDMAGDENFQARFRRESKLAARLNEPHIIPIHDFGEIDGQLYIDMRLVEGVDLSRLIAAEGGALAPALAVDIIGQVAAALTAAHNAGLMHRDIKPSNVLVTGLSDADRSSPFAYLVDFGIARAILGNEGTALTTTTDWFGTVAYMAPERISGSSGDSRSDIYSLACLLYQCVTGRAPFTGEALQVLYAHVNNAPPSASAVRSEVPAGLDAAIRRGMSKNPDDRYQAVGLLAAAAKASVAAGAQAASETQVVRTSTRPILTDPPYAGPQASSPPRSEPPHSRPPSDPHPSFPPPAAGQNSYPPRSAGDSYPPRSGPPQSFPPRSGPPHSVPPRSNAGPGGPAGNRALVIMIALAVVVVLAATIAVIVAVNSGSSGAQGAPPASLSPTSGRSGTDSTSADPTSAAPTTTGATSSMPPPTSATPTSTQPRTGGWANFRDFTELVGTGPRQPASAFLRATCTLAAPDSGVTGMIDQVRCSKLSGGSKVEFYVGRFSTGSDTQAYLDGLEARSYNARYWTIGNERRGRLLTSPNSAKYADVTSSICAMPEYLVQFYSPAGAGLTADQLESDYWAKAFFPNIPPDVCA